LFTAPFARALGRVDMIANSSGMFAAKTDSNHQTAELPPAGYALVLSPHRGDTPWLFRPDALERHLCSRRKNRLIGNVILGER